MTEDKKKFDADGLPPFPWRAYGTWIRDAQDRVIMRINSRYAIGGEIVDAMNGLNDTGWFQPVSEWHEQVYNDLIASTNTLARRNETLRAAVTAVERFKTQRREAASARLSTPADILDTLHDILTSGGANAYEPCEHAVIPNAGPDGLCVAQATTDYNGQRLCKPHADALRALHEETQ